MGLKKYKMNRKTKVLIVAAGEGKRANLDYPKTLYKINKVPILIRILKKIRLLYIYESFHLFCRPSKYINW